jgi:hypothetical protein
MSFFKDVAKLAKRLPEGAKRAHDTVVGELHMISYHSAAQLIICFGDGETQA